MGDTDRKLFVLDTNILLHEPLAIYSFKEHDVVIPMTVLEELDRIKDSKRDVARDARVAIRALEHLFHDATPEEITEGIPLSKQEGATGTISILADYELDETVKAFTDKEGDNRILNAVLYLQAQRTPRAVVLVTKDINMRLRAKGAGVLYVEDYRTDQLIDDIQYLTKGFQTRPGSFWDSVEDVASYTLGGKTFHKLDRAPFDPTFLNQYVIDEDSDFAARVESIDGDKLTLRDLSRERMMHRKAWGITPKNIYQGMALDALLDPDIDLVILTGAAGSGKTLLAMARNTPDIGESIGFLASVTDTLEALHKNDHCTDGSLKYICDKANIQFKSINFMRGRSIQNAFVLLDECQNLTASQIKTIITRCGEGTKIVCSGNLAQIDSHYLTPVTSGLTYMVERFKNFEGSANIHLNGVVRSRLAEFAEENL